MNLAAPDRRHELLYTVAHLREHGAVSFPGASAFDLRRANETLARLRFPAIPEGYARFLNTANGLVWNSIEFYGTRSYPRDGYVLPGLEQANADLATLSDLSGLLVIGMSGEDVFTYRTRNGHYDVRDLVDLDVVERYDSFEALLQTLIEELS